LGKSGSIVSAPGVVERRLMSRRASTSRWMSYSEGCRVRVAIVELKKECYSWRQRSHSCDSLRARKTTEISECGGVVEGVVKISGRWVAGAMSRLKRALQGIV
jgi:hypothetical protein